MSRSRTPREAEARSQAIDTYRTHTFRKRQRHARSIIRRAKDKTKRCCHKLKHGRKAGVVPKGLGVRYATYRSHSLPINGQNFKGSGDGKWNGLGSSMNECQIDDSLTTAFAKLNIPPPLPKRPTGPDVGFGKTSMSCCPSATFPRSGVRNSSSQPLSLDESINKLLEMHTQLADTPISTPTAASSFQMGNSNDSGSTKASSLDAGDQNKVSQVYPVQLQRPKTFNGLASVGQSNYQALGTVIVHKAGTYRGIVDGPDITDFAAIFERNKPLESAPTFLEWSKDWLEKQGKQRLSATVR